MRAAIGIPLGAVLAYALIGTGFLNYDTAYSLLWGGDVLDGRRPDFDLPLAPTPHPLATLLGMLLTPFGDVGQTIWVLVAFLSLGALAWTTYELGAHWFGPAAGIVAALLIITRVPVLSFGVRAYFDIPYVALVLGAILAEARGKDPRTVLLLLGLAGLLRPEAWGFAIVYAAYQRDLKLIPYAAAAPVIWMAHDWAIAGNPLHSLLDTQDNAQDLQRITGLDDVPLTVPRRLGEILREPGLLGAAAGGLLVLAFMRRRAALPIAAGFVSIGAFCVLAGAGLPILGRYLLLPAALLAVFAGAGVFGWRALPADHPWRTRWAVIGAVVIAVALGFTPSQINRIQSLRSAMHTQNDILADLHAISDELGCEPVTVPNHRPVPHIALWTGIPPGEIVSAQLEQPTTGSYIDPASERVERNFTLDPRDPKRLTAAVPRNFDETARNASWVLYAAC
ncbi:hypothetical protein DVA67_022430 [Solirubrobacter sp. CPCC 204708]|uniref:Glycosyltransferase RgtA/B/C/D-like domain-containing protein n=1 Tax=Solirubrobacter deserti TaxID=2282478 RepID=A0ABT4RSX5_9ACTN|nr:hypothetical protein [Solirubrobacter deserti]MBE2318750.1 hypothetical protein [Solirubrobacter deserti]MDA0141340.1 hypothetical protein [Solirubrobacter deserti]